MKKLIVGAIGAAALAASVSAGAQCTAGRWAGWYAGANLGWTSQDTTWNDQSTWGSPIVPFPPPVTSSTRTNDGFSGGLQGGYNWQHGCAVLGVELDAIWSNVDGSKSYTDSGIFAPAGYAVTLQDKVNWYSTLRGRAGVAVDNLLLYLTAGLAYADIKHTWTATNQGFGFPVTAEQFSSSGAWGLAGGVGAEWAVTPTVSVRAEALYIGFGDTSTSGASSYPGIGLTRGVQFNNSDSLVTARVGVNIKF